MIFPRDNEQFTNVVLRDLAESLKRIEDLDFKARTLLQTLKDIASSPNLNAAESAKVREAIINVCTHVSLRKPE
jgi:nucleoid-associated protein YejK